jgi:hypothetical protein
MRPEPGAPLVALFLRVARQFLERQNHFMISAGSTRVTGPRFSARTAGSMI